MTKFNITQAKADLVELKQLAEQGDQEAARVFGELKKKVDAYETYGSEYNKKSAVEKATINVGRGLSDLVVGIGQAGGDLLGVDTQALDRQSKKNEEAARFLEDQPGSTTGYVAGNVLGTIPMLMAGGGALRWIGSAGSKYVHPALSRIGAMTAPAETVAGRIGQGAAVGGGLGAVAPTTPDKARAENLALGTAGGALGVAGLEAASPVASRALKALEPYIGRAVAKVSSAYSGVTGRASRQQIESALRLELTQAGVDWAKVPQAMRDQLVSRATEAMTLPASLPARAMQVQQTAERLPVPIPMSRGQLTREPQQQVLEANRLSAQNENFRDFLAGQRIGLNANLEALVRGTGGNPDLSVAGQSLRGVLETKLGTAKGATGGLYQEAEQSVGAVPVATDSLRGILEANKRQAGNSSVLSTLADELDRIAPDGSAISAAQLNELRKLVGGSMGADKNEQRLGKIVLGEIDNIQSSLGGKYVEAGKMRAAQGAEFENRSLAKTILDSKSQFSLDPKVRDEYVVNSVIRSSEKEIADLKSTILSANEKRLRSVLSVNKKEGVQAFKDLQASVLGTIREQSFDPRSKVFSPDRLLTSIDKIGDKKLEIILGKSKMKTLNDIREIARAIRYDDDLVNRSNTGKVVEQAITDVLSNVDMTGKTQAIVALKNYVNTIRTSRQAKAAMQGVDSAVRSAPVRNNPASEYARRAAAAGGVAAYRE